MAHGTIWCHGKCCGDKMSSRLAPSTQEEQVGLWRCIQDFGLMTSPSSSLLLTQVPKGPPVKVSTHHV